MPPKKSTIRRLSLATPKKSNLITNFFTPEKRFTKRESSQSLLKKVLLEQPVIPKKEQDIIEISDDEVLPSSQQENQLRPRKIQFVETPRKKFTNILNSPKSGTSKPSISKRSPKTRKKTPKVAPEYKIVEGTTFAVDAFQFGSIPDVSHYFLTHFHADHYIGLTKKFPHPILCGKITAALIQKFIGDSLNIEIIDVESPVILEDVEVTAIDANHCPGALMYVFKLLSGKCILHTGDFRACPEMESEPFFWNQSIDTIYLDTTYLKVQYSFKPQTEALDDVVQYVYEAILANPEKNILFICGSYFIGKEKVWLKIAEHFSYKVWVDDKRRNALELFNNEDFTKHLEPDPSKAKVHVLPMGNIGYQNLEEYSKKFVGIFDVFVSFEPSGWRYGKTRNYKFKSRINLVNVEYSEHSSFAELERFVKFLQPTKVISTVPVGKDLHKTCVIPKSWMEACLKPKHRNFQLSITNYLNGKSQKNLTYPQDLEECLSCD